MNTHGDHELEVAANRAEPENQAELVPGPDADPKKNFKFFFFKKSFLPKLNLSSKKWEEREELRSFITKFLYSPGNELKNRLSSRIC